MGNQSMTRDDVASILAELRDPETGRSIAKMEQIHHVTISGARVTVQLGLTTWAGPLREEFRQEAQSLLESRFPAGAEINIVIEEHSRPPEKIGQIGVAAKSVI